MFFQVGVRLADEESLEEGELQVAGPQDEDALRGRPAILRASHYLFFLKVGYVIRFFGNFCKIT